MSELAYPRIHFQGGFHTSPCTANNDYESIAIDAASVRLQEPLASMTDEQATQWMLTTFEASDGGPKQLWIRCGWNYYGNYDTAIDNALVSAVVARDGTSPDGDPLLGAAVSLVGDSGTNPVIVDSDPTGIVTTQIFVGGFSLGGQNLGIQARGHTRCYSRWRNNTRNLSTVAGNPAAAIFQFGVPKAGLSFAGVDRSPILTEFQLAMEDALGVLFQFAVYQVQPTLTEAELAAQYQQGRFVNNPAVGLAVGTIGLWEPGDLQTEVNGRRLHPPAKPNLTYQSQKYTLGTAAFRVQPGNQVVSLNLANSIPETSYQSQGDAMQKVGLGTLRLMSKAAGGQPVLLGQIAPEQYGYAAYAARGGIVDVPVQAAGVDLENSQLLLVEDQSQGDEALLSEPAYVVESDDRALYFDQPQMSKVQFLVRQRGVPPGADVTIHLWEYQFQPLPTPPGGLTVWDLLPALAHRIQFPAQITVPAGQTEPVTFQVQAIAPGSLSLVYTVNDDPPPDPNSPVFPWMSAYFTNMRVLPEDNFDALTAPTYQDIYQHILRYFFLIYPAMSQVIPLDSQEAVAQAATAILDRTDPAKWLSPLYMPVTRELSGGKRKLIERWAQSVIPKGGLTS